MEAIPPERGMSSGGVGKLKSLRNRVEKAIWRTCLTLPLRSGALQRRKQRTRFRCMIFLRWPRETRRCHSVLCSPEHWALVLCVPLSHCGPI